MKLIVDIDDNVFTRLFDNGVDTSSDDRVVIDRAVRNGMPYEESQRGDLISREALKEEVNKKNVVGRFNTIMLIDNAPTVSDRTEEVLSLQNTIAKIVEGIAENTRPQGEWKEYNFRTCGGLGDWDYKCSKCGKVYGGKHNFCPNCGADMRGGGDK